MLSEKMSFYAAQAIYLNKLAALEKLYTDNKKTRKVCALLKQRKSAKNG